MASPPVKVKPFLVQRQEAVLVTPSGPSPPGLLSLSSIDNDPNLDLICQSVYVYVADQEEQPAGGVIMNGRHQVQGSDLWRSDPASMIKEGLSKALVHYYPLAGRMRRKEDGKLRVDCTAEGVPFSSATATCTTLASLNYLEGVDVGEAKQLVFQVGAGGGGDGDPPLMMQVTRFACGGFTVGMGLSHAVCDGFGSAQFLRAVAELAGEGRSEPTVKPMWERERLVAAAPATEWRLDQNLPATSPHLPSSDLVHGCFDVEVGTIGRLKRALKEESGECDGAFTTLEALGAFIWRSRFRALEMNLEGTTHFSLAVGIRNSADPPLPEGYYGNAFVGSHTFLRGRDLCEGPLWRVVAAIRETKRKALEAEYVAPYLGLLERMSREKARPGGRGAALVVTDWRHMGLAAAGFGGKQAVNVVPLPWDMFGYVDLCIFLRPFSLDASMKGGVRVLVCLPRAAMARFEEEMDYLKGIPEEKPSACSAAPRSLHRRSLWFVV